MDLYKSGKNLLKNNLLNNMVGLLYMRKNPKNHYKVTILVRLMDWGCDRCGPWETKVQKLGFNKKSITARAPYNGLKMNCHSKIRAPLRTRTMWLWQKSVQSNKKFNSLAWIGMIQPAMQLRFSTQNMKSFILMTL